MMQILWQIQNGPNEDDRFIESTVENVADFLQALKLVDAITLLMIQTFQSSVRKW
jgi:hypothetical protein